MILKILLLASGIILALQDFEDREITSCYGFIFLIITSVVYKLNSAIVFLALLYYIIRVLNDRPVDISFIIITGSVITLTTHIVPIWICLLLFYVVLRNEKKVPMVGVCSILIGLLTLLEM